MSGEKHDLLFIKFIYNRTLIDKNLTVWLDARDWGQILFLFN